MRNPMLSAVLRAVREDATSASRLEPFVGENLETSLHLAVLVEPYLGFILDGSKTVESRFSTHPIAPYGRVGAGDTILLKPPSEPICGICTVAESWQYQLTDTSRAAVQDRFGPFLQAQPGFWESRAHARYVTLIAITDVAPTAPIPVPKKDRRGWVVLYAPETQLSWDV